MTRRRAELKLLEGIAKMKLLISHKEGNPREEEVGNPKRKSDD